MNALRKITALFLAMAITLTFMPSMVFAEATDDDAGGDMYETYSSVWLLDSKEGTDAQQTDDIIKVGWDYVSTGNNLFEPVVSKDTPGIFESYIMLNVEKDTYRVLQPENIFVTDMKGNLVDAEIIKADEDAYGRIKIAFTKAGKYLICCEEEREGFKGHYTAELEVMDDSYIDNAVKQLKIKGVSVTSKKGSQTIKWKSCDYVSGYAIYRSTSKSSGYKKVATVKWNKNSYTFKKGLKRGKRYYYKVVGFRATMKVGTKYSNIVSATAK